MVRPADHLFLSQSQDGQLGDGQAEPRVEEEVAVNVRATPPVRRFQSVTAGYYHTCGIETDGSLACWGTQEAGAVMVPPSGLFETVSVAHRHAGALEPGGRAVCWSYDSGPSLLAPPDPDAVFKSVSTGGYLDDYRVCGTKADDTDAPRCSAPGDQ